MFSNRLANQNYLRFRVSPNLTIGLGALVKKAGDQMRGDPVELLATEHPDPSGMLAYEELLDNAMRGDQMRFAREDYVEEAWRIVQPVLGNTTPLHFYEPGAWGPAESDALAAADGGWRDPS